MTRLAPASIPWLLVHELRLVFRSWMKKPSLAIWLVLGLPVVFLTFAGVQVALSIQNVSLVPAPLAVIVLDVAVAVLFTLVLSQTLSAATEALYERGDLDLLLSSPIAPRRVLIVRSLGIATSPFLLWSSLATPVIGPIILFGHWRLLAVYPVIAGLSLAASAVGLLLAIGLFILIGPRRTRTIAQVMAALVGASFFIGLQSRNIFPEARLSFFSVLQNGAASGYFNLDSVFSWPALALLGAPLPLAALFGAAALLFAGVTHVVGNRFAGDAAMAAGADIGRARRISGETALPPFRSGGFATMIRKELKLLRRDPVLLSQIFMRVLFMLPLTLLLFRNAQANASAAVAAGTGALAFLSSQLSASFAWTTISAEDAPDLLASAPIDAARARLAKLTAALIPVAVLFSVPIAVLVVLSPWDGLVAALGVSLGSLATASINLWLEKPETRKHFRRRQSGSLVRLMGELFVAVGAGLTTAMSANASPWAAAPLLVTLAILWALYSGRTTREAAAPATA